MGKNTSNNYNVTESGGFDVIAPTGPASTSKVTSGAHEPTWPTTLYATVHDGGVTWTAIYARKTTGTVTGLLSPQIFQHNKLVYPAHYFQYGYLIWLTGNNAGRRIDIRDSMGEQQQNSGPNFRPYIYLFEICANPIQIGDTFTAVVGCTKERLKCQYFNNFANFRGFPDMPTEERALQTPNIMNQGYAPKQTK
jgi:uncharacterized phage protein (TIGR02218 family)